MVEYPPDFESWWAVWPKKKSSKAEALGEWKKLAPDAALVAVMVAAVTDQIAAKESERRRGEFVADFKDAVRWIKYRMWETSTEALTPTKTDFQLRLEAAREEMKERERRNGEDQA